MTSVVLSAGIITGAATLSGCDSNEQQPSNIETPGTGVSNPDEVDGVEANAGENPEQNPTDEPNQPEGESVDISGLPADWESWGVSAEIAQARWNYILSEVNKLEEQGCLKINYWVPEGNPDEFCILWKETPDASNWRGGNRSFPTNHRPPLY